MFFGADVYIPNITFVTVIRMQKKKIKKCKKNAVKMKKLLMEPKLKWIYLGLHVWFGILCLLNCSLNPGKLQGNL